jgi:mono/diheme cytochrome c family protein
MAFLCRVLAVACTWCTVSPFLTSASGQNTPPKKTASPGNDSAAIENASTSKLEELKRTGLHRSQYRASPDAQAALDRPPETPTEPRIEEFKLTIEPILKKACADCHGSDDPQGNIRIDTLDPNLHTGGDLDWWNEIFAVISKGEMPPSDSMQLSDDEKTKIVDWLSHELQSASLAKRNSTSHTSFRRLTRYEYNHALQDLLGLPWDFAKDLPPEANSEDGFQNSSETLHMSVTQFETFYRSAHAALTRAIHVGQKPESLYWGISMSDVSKLEWPKQEAEKNKLKQKFEGDPEKLEQELKELEKRYQQSHARSYFRNRLNGRTAIANWDYGDAKYANAPHKSMPKPPEEFSHSAILPAGQSITIELGDQLPDHGPLRVRVLASRVDANKVNSPSLRLYFGWQASNEGRALLPVSKQDLEIDATNDTPKYYEWEIELGEIYPRNSVRGDSPMGATPSPSEYIRLANSSATPNDIQIDYVEVQSLAFDQWPPQSHLNIFPTRFENEPELDYATRVISRFMTRAWRRPISEQEISKKLQRYSEIRPECENMESAVLEVLASVIASPHFLYVAPDTTSSSRTAGTLTSDSQSDKTSGAETKTERDRIERILTNELATRLALFLWSGIPDEELMQAAQDGSLSNPEILKAQVARMLADPKSERFAEHFVTQWLNIELLDFLNIQQNVPGFDPLLKEAMRQEPIALFREVLRSNASVLDFLHSDYTVANERLARHYGIEGVYGNHFRRIPLNPNDVRRGGLLTQAGLLMMNSDYPDSHPLKRGKWVLVSLLNDPPPPPPPAVPQIDLANPEIAKMTLKERIEDHRNHPACMACHMKIDPWGIAFENYDAVGRWRDQVNGKPIDASSKLYNDQWLDGIVGLKSFLLENRQDQFVRAMVHKLSTYALGRPLKFSDRADVEGITAQVRLQGDGLQTLVTEIVCSELFRCR